MILIEVCCIDEGDVVFIYVFEFINNYKYKYIYEKIMFVWIGEKDYKYEYMLFLYCEMYWVKVKNILNMYKFIKLYVKWLIK